MERAEAADAIDRKVGQLFALVTEALAQATGALLNGDLEMGRRVVAGDQAVDDLTAEVEMLVWGEIDRPSSGQDLRHLVGILLILPELERSGDLAEHVAQRAVDNLGVEMTPVSRGIVQRMTEVALDMWQSASGAYRAGRDCANELAEQDDEIDILHDRLMREIEAEEMPIGVSSQVTLLARFYERLGDHAVNLAKRVEVLRAS